MGTMRLPGFFGGSADIRLDLFAAVLLGAGAGEQCLKRFVPYRILAVQVLA